MPSGIEDLLFRRVVGIGGFACSRVQFRSYGFRVGRGVLGVLGLGVDSIC